jgi:hypothetical protein
VRVDTAVLDLNPGLQLVRLTKAVGIAQPFEVAFLEPIGRRLVVVANAHLERDLRQALDRLRGNPGDSGHG